MTSQGDPRPGTPPDREPGARGGQTGTNVCPACAGTGRAGDRPCPTCAGTGMVEEPVGDA